MGTFVAFSGLPGIDQPILLLSLCPVLNPHLRMSPFEPNRGLPHPCSIFAISAFEGKTDIRLHNWDVRLVPKTEAGQLYSIASSAIC
jgi:hypothetical protein